MHSQKNGLDIKNKVGYQIFPISFKDSNDDGMGDLKGIEEKLPYLKELGIDIIWLCPIYQTNFVDAGYDVIDYYKIDKRFGSLKDFKSLMAKAKKLKIDIMMDLVLNHASTDSYEFKEACKSRNNKYHDFFIWSDKPNLKNESIFGSSAWEYVPKVKQYYLHIFSKDQADFNFHSEAFRKWLYNILIYWIKLGVKYFRFDAIEHVGKTTDPYIIRYGKDNYKFLLEISKNVCQKFDAYVIGESWNVTPQIMKKYCNKDKIVNSFFNFSTLFFDWKNENGSLAKIKNEVDWKDLKDYFLWQSKELLTSPSWTNHDVPRALDRYFKPSLEQRYFAQTAMILFLMTTRGIPFIYQGEEFGMSPTKIKKFSDFHDPQIFTKRDEFIKEKKYSNQEYFDACLTGSRDLSRSIMSWNSKPNSGFTKVGIKPFYNKSILWKEVNAEKDMQNKNKSIYFFTKKMIELRKSKMGEFFTNFDRLEVIELKSNFTLYKLIKNKEQIFVSINWSNKNLNVKRKLNSIIYSNYPTKNISNSTIQTFEATIFK